MYFKGAVLYICPHCGVGARYLAVVENWDKREMKMVCQSCHFVFPVVEVVANVVDLVGNKVAEDRGEAEKHLEFFKKGDELADVILAHKQELEKTHVSGFVKMEERDFLRDVAVELQAAREKYPKWPECPLHAFAVVQEQIGKAGKAVLDTKYKGIDREEAYKWVVVAAAMLVRFASNFDNEEFERIGGFYNWRPANKHQQGDV